MSAVRFRPRPPCTATKSPLSQVGFFVGCTGSARICAGLTAQQEQVRPRGHLRQIRLSRAAPRTIPQRRLFLKTQACESRPSSFCTGRLRLFEPEYHVPLIVLTSNDTCIIAPGNEAKACGIAIGAPFLSDSFLRLPSGSCQPKTSIKRSRPVKNIRYPVLGAFC